MARFGDKGPYSPDNVKIIKAEDNVRERIHTKRGRESIAKHMSNRNISDFTRRKMSMSARKRCSTSKEKKRMAKIGERGRKSQKRGAS